MSSHRYPDGNVFYRKLTRDYPLITRGEGCWLFGDDGKRYLDGSGGAFVANLGHGIGEIADAMAEQARKVAYVTGMYYTTEVGEHFCSALAALAPGDLDYVYPLCSGSEAVEAALKLARQYWVETGRPAKHKILALTPGYHGNTLLALSASAREHYKKLYKDWLVDVPRVPAPYGFRCACGGKPPYCDACSGNALETVIIEEGPDTIAAFIAEPVGGSSTGASVPNPGYWRRVRDICNRYGILFVADEVLCGAGRTGTFSAIEQFGVVPDLIVFGKGIAGGYAPLSALVAPRRIVDPVAQLAGAFVHAQTYSHHAVSCAAGLAALRYLQHHDLVARVASTSAAFFAALKPLRAHPHVGDIRGIGLLAGIEFVADQQTRMPLRRSEKFAERFTEAAIVEELVVWPNVGHLPIGDGDIIMLAPPFTITAEECAELAARLGRALARVS
jgi:adenosylmethionine-8-amino-7-oxononanoate aminotransferase